MNNREIGARYETMACDYMKRQGFVILRRNFSCRQGEIDIIGEHEGYLVFAEVKYRADITSGYASESVTRIKQKKVCRSADYYRYIHGIGEERPIRYDVVAIQGEEICWYQNAFGHVYAGQW